MSAAIDESAAWPHVQCRRTVPHDPHKHVNEGPRGGCGLPEWCEGITELGITVEAHGYVSMNAEWLEACRQALLLAEKAGAGLAEAVR